MDTGDYVGIAIADCVGIIIASRLCRHSRLNGRLVHIAGIEDSIDTENHIGIADLHWVTRWHED